MVFCHFMLLCINWHAISKLLKLPEASYTMYQAKDLFQLQTELVEAKVDMAVSKAIDRVLDRIDRLQRDMNARFTAIDARFAAIHAEFAELEKDMVAVKTKLGMLNETKSMIRTKLIEYALQAIWLTVGSVFTYIVIHLHNL